MVMLVAHHLACGVLPEHTSKFSRKDFTLPQLFACLTVREQMRLSYRGAEALLLDGAHWCREIGMRKTPDHNTLCRAFHALNLGRRGRGLLDMLAQWFAIARQLGDTAAIDSSLYDTHHRSRHYEQRCRHYASREKSTANRRRSRSARRTPKLAFAADTRTHLILSARARIGMSADYRDFDPLLFDAWRRHRGKRLKQVLADAGYDSESNHRIARRDMGIRSLIKTGSGRPTNKPPGTKYRRLMHRQLAGSQKGKAYGQRAQAETVASMLKRNLGDALRARSNRARRHNLTLRSITHGVMLLRRQMRASRQSRRVPGHLPARRGLDGVRLGRQRLRRLPVAFLGVPPRQRPAPRHARRDAHDLQITQARARRQADAGASGSADLLERFSYGRSGTSAVAHEAHRVLGGDRCDRFADGVEQFAHRAAGQLSQDRLDLAARHLNRIEIR